MPSSMESKIEHIMQVRRQIIEAELREPHSDAYRDGLAKAVALRLTGSPCDSPFAPGTLENDAFNAGAKRGLECTQRYAQLYSRDTRVFFDLHADPKALVDRLARGRAMAERIIRALQVQGMGAAQLIGSMASGDIHENSDVDILVFDCGSLDPFHIIGEMEDGYLGREIGDEGIPVDCVVPAIMVEKERQRWMEMRTTSQHAEDESS